MMDINDIIEQRRNYFDKIKSHKYIFAYGAGSKGRQTAEILFKEGICISAFIDSNQELHGGKCHWGYMGVEGSIDIVSYEDVKKNYTDYCILITTTIKSANEIYKTLISKGERNEIFFCANPSKAENRFLSEEELRRDGEKYQISYDLLKDSLSQEIFKKFILWKATGNLESLVRYTEDTFTAHFDKNILGEEASQEYIDIGAYTGDSICRFLACFGGNYKHIYCVEMDINNFVSLKKCIQSCRLDNVYMYNVALWERKEKKVQFGCKIGNYESCNLFRSTEQTIGEGEALKVQVSIATETETETMDNLFKNIHPTLIKLDVLASEMPILYGAKELICRDKPHIVMEYGTHLDYISDTICYLKNLNPNYQFILRQKSFFGNSRTILYVV